MLNIHQVIICLKLQLKMQHYMLHSLNAFSYYCEQVTGFAIDITILFFKLPVATHLAFLTDNLINNF